MARFDDAIGATALTEAELEHRFANLGGPQPMREDPPARTWPVARWEIDAGNGRPICRWVIFTDGKTTLG
jgi:hypothetical protein